MCVCVCVCACAFACASLLIPACLSLPVRLPPSFPPSLPSFPPSLPPSLPPSRARALSLSLTHTSPPHLRSTTFSGSSSPVSLTKSVCAILAISEATLNFLSQLSVLVAFMTYALVAMLVSFKQHRALPPLALVNNVVLTLVLHGFKQGF
jgi:hypothetical protein